MQEELLKLREKIRSQKSAVERDFEEEMEQLRRQKDTAEDKFRSMESLVNVLKRTIGHLKK